MEENKEKQIDELTAKEKEKKVADGIRKESEKVRETKANSTILDFMSNLKKDTNKVENEAPKKQSNKEKRAFHEISKHFQIRVVFGYHNKYEDDVPAVIIESVNMKNKSYTFFLEELLDGSRVEIDQMRTKLKRIGVMSDTTWKLLRDKAKRLYYTDGLYEEVSVIVGIITSKQTSVAKANYDKVFSFCIGNEARFASLKANDFVKDYHYGVKLDTQKMKKKYGKELWAITSNTLTKQILLDAAAYDGKRGNKALHDFKETLEPYIHCTKASGHENLLLTPMKEKFTKNGDKVETEGDTKGRMWCMLFSISGPLGSIKPDTDAEDEGDYDDER